MGMNAEGCLGILRILTVVLGVVTLGLVADKYFKISNEQFLLTMVILLFIFSLLWTAAVFMDLTQISDTANKIDIAVHLIGGLLLVVASIVWITSVMDIESQIQKPCKSLPYRILKVNCSFSQIQRLVAGILCTTNGIIYLVLGGLSLKIKNF